MHWWWWKLDLWTWLQGAQSISPRAHDDTSRFNFSWHHPGLWRWHKRSAPSLLWCWWVMQSWDNWTWLHRCSRWQTGHQRHQVSHSWLREWCCFAWTFHHCQHQLPALSIGPHHSSWLGASAHRFWHLFGETWQVCQCALQAQFIVCSRLLEWFQKMMFSVPKAQHHQFLLYVQFILNEFCVGCCQGGTK